MIELLLFFPDFFFLIIYFLFWLKASRLKSTHEILYLSHVF